MNNSHIDLSNCDLEPIRVPGQIQSHGLLIATDAESLIQYHSENTDIVPGLPTDLIGWHLNDIQVFFSFKSSFGLLAEQINKGKIAGFEKVNPVPVQLGGKPFNLIMSVSGQYCLLEFEPAAGHSDLSVNYMIGRSITEMLVDRDLGHLLDNTVAVKTH